MIKSVTVTNHLGDSLRLELMNPELSGLIIENIEGLGPAKADVNTTTIATFDGSIFNSSRLQNRNIVITLAMLSAPLIEDARLKTYKYFPIKKRVSLMIETDRRTVETVGYVESNEPDIFSEHEKTQISIVCPDPYFYEVANSETIFYGVIPGFEFPFENEDPVLPTIEFGEIVLDTRAILTYTGDAETGVLINISTKDEVGDITIYNIDTQESMFISVDKIEKITGKAFGPGDDILISTVKGSKYVRLLRHGTYTNIISAINKNSDWFQLSNGDNVFAFVSEFGETNVIMSFTYRNAYGGV